MFESKPCNDGCVRFASVGDLLLTVKPGAKEPQRGFECLSPEIRKIFTSCDVVLANLECTMPGTDRIDTEPRVFSSVSQIRTLKNSGITLVSLGNNHTFDGKDDGFQLLVDLLKEVGISCCGAGRNKSEALAPAILELKGLKLAVVAVVDKSSGMYRFASQDSSGVAQLETEELCQTIASLKNQVDHVIVTPHWGDERFRFPSPRQIQHAHSFVEAGASMVIGHHPHVMQGLESYKGSPVIYSLGNFLANDVYWEDGGVLTWNRFERTSCIMIAEIDKKGVVNIQQIPVFDDGETIRIENSGWGESCLAKVNKLLERGVTPFRYRCETFRVRTLKPIISHLRWSEIRRVRPGHFFKALKLFSQSMK